MNFKVGKVSEHNKRTAEVLIHIYYYLQLEIHSKSWNHILAIKIKLIKMLKFFIVYTHPYQITKQAQAQDPYHCLHFIFLFQLALLFHSFIMQYGRYCYDSHSQRRRFKVHGYQFYLQLLVACIIQVLLYTSIIKLVLGSKGNNNCNFLILIQVKNL